MKRVLKWLIILAVIGGGVAVATPKIREEMKKRNAPKFTTRKVKRGDLKWQIQTSGTVQPVLKVQIGSFVSGPIKEIHADFNQQVEEGELLAMVDQRIYRAALLRDEAALAIAEAEVKRVQANLQQAINDERRSKQLRKINPDYISDTEMDQYRYARQALEAQKLVAEESIKQAEGRLNDSQANLDFTSIRAPMDGVIIDRKIDQGQTLAAQFQTPELFVLAPDMDQRMWVHASVVEAEVGHILRAQQEGRPVTFYVDAYKDQLFEGKIHQVRQNSTSEQNVVTYPVIVETPNPGSKLMPGMTANLSFEIETRMDVLLIPGQAIRFLPDAAHVRKEDKKILEGSEEEADDELIQDLSAASRVDANRKRRLRHVWVKDGEKLKAVQIEFGLDDGRWYELVEGELKEGMELVTGTESKRG